MTSTQSTIICGKSKRLPFSVAALLSFFIIILLLSGQRVSVFGVVALVFMILWLPLWLSLTLSWGIQMKDDEIADGYRIPGRGFRVRRKLCLHEIGKVSGNGLGDVILFRKNEYRFPGRSEIVISHDLTDFEVLVQRILQSVEPGTVDENLNQRFLKGTEGKQRIRVKSQHSTNTK